MTTTYHIYNPTQARRVIYDGSENQKEIVIDPGEVKRDVSLADHIAVFHTQRRDDLVLTRVERMIEQESEPERPKLTLPKRDIKI